MTTRSRRLHITVPLAVVSLVLASCGPGGGSPSTVPPSPSASTAPAPSADESAASTGAPEAGQTDTGWGRIWDTVPAGFPVFPRAVPADDATGEPASARFSVAGGDPLAIAEWMQDALETATFSTDALNGPAEDGGYVIESVGDGDCRIQTRIAPLGDLTFVTVLYGADCPGP
jgi:hypothetical protein